MCGGYIDIPYHLIGDLVFGHKQRINANRMGHFEIFTSRAKREREREREDATDFFQPSSTLCPAMRRKQDRKKKLFMYA